MGYSNNEQEWKVINIILDAIRKPILLNSEIQKCFDRIRSYSYELYIHSANVALLSGILGIYDYGVCQEMIELSTAALLHDYGKIFISKCILEKADALTEDERKTIELHSIAGYFYLKQETNLNERILNAILDHHEKLDGSGYGLRKKGSSISDFAKIIAIAMSMMLWFRKEYIENR